MALQPLQTQVSCAMTFNLVRSKTKAEALTWWAGSTALCPQVSSISCLQAPGRLETRVTWPKWGRVPGSPRLLQRPGFPAFQATALFSHFLFLLSMWLCVHNLGIPLNSQTLDRNKISVFLRSVETFKKQHQANIASTTERKLCFSINLTLSREFSAS